MFYLQPWGLFLFIFNRWKNRSVKKLGTISKHKSIPSFDRSLKKSYAKDPPTYPPSSTSIPSNSWVHLPSFRPPQRSRNTFRLRRRNRRTASWVSAKTGGEKEEEIGQKEQSAGNQRRSLRTIQPKSWFRGKSDPQRRLNQRNHQKSHRKKHPLQQSQQGRYQHCYWCHARSPHGTREWCHCRRWAGRHSIHHIRRVVRLLQNHSRYPNLS